MSQPINEDGNHVPAGAEPAKWGHPGEEDGVGAADAEEVPREPVEPNMHHAATTSQALDGAGLLRAVPEHLHSLALRINTLNEADLVMIAEIAEEYAKRGVYSLLPYTGSNWFLPQIREVEEGESHWSIQCGAYGRLSVTLGGRRLLLPVTNILLRIVVVVLCWFALWNMLPHWLMEPGGYVWDPAVTVVVSAAFGGLICRVLQIPPLVGVLWIAIMWNNVPYESYLTRGIVLPLKDIVSKLGLTVIMARAGYSLTFKGIRPHWKQSLMLATLPYACEGVAHSLIANKIFNYDNNYQWAFLQGMVSSIVSPAVVVPGTLYLHELGYGHGCQPFSLLLSAVGLEIVFGVWATNFIIGLLFQEQKLAVAIVLGPVQLIGGCILGIALGVVFFYLVEILKREAERLPNGKYEKTHFYATLDFSTFIFLLLASSMVFLGYSLNLAGGGCTMCVFFASAVTHLCIKDGNAELEQQQKYIGSWLAFLWDNLAMPCLFAVVGSKISISAIFNREFFPKAVVCLVSSTAVRVLVTFLVQLGAGMTFWEKMLVCAGYTGKASAQCSLGSLAATLVAEEIANLAPGVQPSAALLQRKEFANNVQQVAAMYVMFMAAAASFTLVRGGVAILPRTAPKKRSQRPRTSTERSSALDDEEEGRKYDGNAAAVLVELREQEVHPTSAARAA
ncbi:Na/H hydrogen antiporter 1 [Trypanosoma conorhini]|uniref:Na/H hydrogen antiporter 1 n=1 Tax=Trypanosoma conorhini TaxID=83891 RepID=A0A3R7L4H3_9TRYP|nr:Na/H hydrogen antiporter 1 [Trypanosoma conorhini]RNF20929.1 Na/H hydrogen antiporter 1 [Trypanosoma conorhini]